MCRRNRIKIEIKTDTGQSINFQRVKQINKRIRLKRRHLKLNLTRFRRHIRNVDRNGRYWICPGNYPRSAPNHYNFARFDTD